MSGWVVVVASSDASYETTHWRRTYRDARRFAAEKRNNGWHVVRIERGYE